MKNTLILLYNNKQNSVLWLIICLVIIAFGWHYRSFSEKYGDFSGGKVQLPVPLKEFPMDFGDWHGEDVELSDVILKVAGNDDYLNRLYVNTKTGEWFNLYLAYTGDPRTMLGHRPQVCYPAAGWNPQSLEEIEISVNNDLKVPCLLHHFYRPGRSDQPGAQVVVLNYYILNGQITNQEESFDGIGTRAPNIDGETARYVAQIQISSSNDGSVQNGLKYFAGKIMDFFPGRQLD